MEEGDNEDDFDEGTNGDSENKGKGGKEEDNEGYLIAVDGEQDIGSKSQFNLAEQLQGREETVTYGCDGRLNKVTWATRGATIAKWRAVCQTRLARSYSSPTPRATRKEPQLLSKQDRFKKTPKICQP